MLRTDNDATNLPQIRGTGEEHLRYFIENRLNYCDSKWYAGSYPEDNAVVRIYTPVDTNGAPLTNLTIPANANITVTPYSAMYAGVRYKANGTLYQERLEENETHTFVAPNETFNDTETAIYGASQLSSLGDLAPLYLGYIDVGAATKLVELKIGDGTPGYKNANLYHLAVGTNRLLKKIDIQNCGSPRFVQALVLTGCPNIEEIYAKGSSITGVELPDSGYLKVLQLPATITNLTLKNQLYIEDLTIEGLDRLKTITIENTPVDTLNILNNAVNVERVRLTDVDWHYADASILCELIDRNIGGIDENGTNTDTMWIDGKCHIETLTGNELAEIKRLYPYLDITYTTLTSQLIFMTESGQIDSIDTLPKIGVDESIAIANGSTSSNNGWFVTELYELHKTLSTSSDSCTIDYYIPHSTKTYNIKIHCFNGDTFVTDKSQSIVEYVEGTSVEPSSALFTGTSYTMNKVRFNVDKNCVDISYAYCRDTGEVLFAGKNTPYYGLKNINDTAELHRQTILNGGDGTDPVADGTIAIPTKASTAQYHHNFNGWALEPYGSANPDALLKVEADRYVYAAFTNEIRSYTVNFYSGTKLLYSTVVEYGSDATYVGNTPTNEDFEFYGWSPSPTNIQGETNCYAQFHDLRGITDDWSVIAQSCLDGTATSKYEIGAFKPIIIGGNKLPYDFYNGGAVVYNDEIHIFGGINKKAHYKWNGSEWISISTLPYEFYEGSIIVYNNDIHIFGGSGGHTKHYKWNVTEGWIELSALPYAFYRGNAVVYNGEVHLLASHRTTTAHYKFDGSTWNEVSTLPYGGFYKKAIVYKDKIHLFGGTSGYTKHYNFDGNTWVEDVELPYAFHSGCSIVYNNELHLIGSMGSVEKLHYKFNDIEWTKVADLPFSEYYGSSIVFNNQIHVLGSYILDYKNSHYYFDGTKWNVFGEHKIINMEVVAHEHDELAVDYKWNVVGSWQCDFQAAVHNGKIYSAFHSRCFCFDGTTVKEISSGFVGTYGTKMISYQGKLHAFPYHSKTENGDNIHLIYNETDNIWERQALTPMYSKNPFYIVFNDLLYAFGGESGVIKTYYTYDGATWTKIADDMPSNVKNSACVYNNILHFIFDNTKHYTFDGTTWTLIGTLPFNAGNGTSVVYNNELHYWGTNSDLYAHYKYNGSTWVQCTDRLLYEKAAMVVLNDELYACSKNGNICKYVTSSWVSSDIETLYSNPEARGIVEYQGKLHIIGGWGTNAEHSVYDGTECVALEPCPYNIPDCRHVVYNNEIHTMNNGQHYKYNGTEWSTVCELSFTPYGNARVVYDNCIYVVDHSNKKTIYKYNGVEWISLGDKGIQAYQMTVYNNELYCTNYKNIYRWENETWVNVVEMPSSFASAVGNDLNQISFISYNDKIHIFNSKYGHYTWDGSKFDIINTNITDILINPESSVVYREKLYTVKGYSKNLYVFEHPKATLTFIARNTLANARKMDNGAFYQDGWSTSGLRNWCNIDLFDLLPDYLQNGIKNVSKLADGGYNNQVIVQSDDNIWIPSMDELGLSSDDTTHVLGQGECYPVFTDNKSRIKYLVDNTTKVNWWTRSHSLSNPNAFRYIMNNGWHGNMNQIGNANVLIGFCI